VPARARRDATQCVQDLADLGLVDHQPAEIAP